MNYNNFDPTNLYTRKPMYTEDEDENDLYNTINDDNIEILNNNTRANRNNLHPIPQYYNNTMPQMSQLDLLEKDINMILEPTICDNSLDVGRNEVIETDYENDKAFEFNKDFNTDSLVDNNVSEKKRNEVLQDYFVTVDSNDRDITKYPNPFIYKVYFNSFTSDDASITKSFDRVKSIKLETAILPTQYYFTRTDVSLNGSGDDITVRNLTDSFLNETFDLTSTDVSGTFAVVDVVDSLSDTTYTRSIKFADETIYPTVISSVYEYNFTFDASGGTLPDNVHDSNTVYPSSIYKFTQQTYSLMDNKYNLLYVDEFSYTNEYSTNDVVAKSFSIMFPDCKNTNVYYTTSKFKDKVYNFSNLGSVNRMTISLKDHVGNQLKNSYADYTDLDVPSTKTCSCYTDVDGYLTRNYRCACSYFRHPFYQHFQNILIFKISCYEVAIDKEIFN